MAKFLPGRRKGYGGYDPAMAKAGVELHVNSEQATVEVYSNSFMRSYMVKVSKRGRPSLRLVGQEKCWR